MKIIYDQFHILIAILSNSITEIHHIFRLQKEIHQHILKSHKKVKPFKHSCWHKCHKKLSAFPDFLSFFLKWLPESRI